jgi:choline dehydrogenase-like flavoprotein
MELVSGANWCRKSCVAGTGYLIDSCSKNLSRERIKVAVLGSGPAGVAAAKALLLHGVSVTMLDAGNTMPAEALSVRDAMASAVPDEWDSEAVERLNAQGLKDRGHMPLKTTFGSDYPYDFDADIAEHGASILGSHARGGLSNVWGASILPLSDADIAGWPISMADLAPHYAAVLKWLPHSQVTDELSDTYPLHSSYQRKLGLSRQAHALLGDLRSSAEQLNNSGISFGQARLAMSNCFYCGQCLIGCPYQFVYSTNETLDDLRDYPGFTYLGDTLVQGLTEHGSHVALHVQQAGQLRTIEVERLFMGAGVLGTAKLLMPLLKEKELLIKDSAYSLIPFLRYDKVPRVEFESLYTLPQLFMEVNVPELTSRNAHLQWYSYNDFYQQEIRKTFGKAYRALPTVFPRQIIERMWTIQGFLHSDDSPEILMRFDENFRKIDLSAVENPKTKKLFKAVLRKLSAMSGEVGGRPVPFFSRVGTAGGGFHAGSSFPMALNPGRLQSDVSGRPAGLSRIHVVDSSVLPNIASSTITLSVMANAHRIASDYAKSIS